MTLSLRRWISVPRYGRTYAVTVVLAALCLWFLGVAALIAARTRPAPEENSLASGGLTVEAARREYDAAHRQVRRARAEAKAAKSEYDELLTQSSDERRAAADELESYNDHRAAQRTSPDGRAAQRTMPDGSQPAALVDQESYVIAVAERDALVARLHELLALRDRLQGQLTPRHPQLREVETQAADAARRLAAMQVPAFASGNEGNTSSNPTGDRLSMADNDAVRAELVEAERRVARTAGVEQKAVERYVGASERLSAAMLGADGPEPTFSHPWALAVLWISLVLVGLAGLNFLRQAKGTFPSIGSVRAWLGRPIVGVLSGPAPRWEVGCPSSTTAAITGLVVASEATLCFAAFALTAALIVNLALLPQLLTDPLHAIHSGAQQLWHAGR